MFEICGALPGNDVQHLNFNVQNCIRPKILLTPSPIVNDRNRLTFPSGRVTLPGSVRIGLEQKAAMKALKKKE